MRKFLLYWLLTSAILKGVQVLAGQFMGRPDVEINHNSIMGMLFVIAAMMADQRRNDAN